ncbi:unnamed protein product [Alopecurus aequalis]
MMDPAPITQLACVDAKRLLSSTTPADPVSKVLDDDNTSSWPAPVPPLDDENLLQEILLRLPSKPSSIPRASLVCTRWCSILSDPEFLKRFRKHNRMPPLLGFFAGAPCMTPGMKHNFVPVLDTKPNRIPAERFAVPKRSNSCDYWNFLGCRHGLAVLISESRHEAVVWDPLTGQQHRVPFPPGLLNAEGDTFWAWHAAVLCADNEDGHVHGDCFSSPFKLALTCGNDTQAFACLYNSASGVWGNIVSTVTNSTIVSIRPSVLIGNAVYWLLFGGDILVFDIERQTLSVIEKPADAHRKSVWSFQLLRIDGGSGLGLAVMLKPSIQLWKRKSNCDGVVEWVLLQKIIQLEGLFPREPHSDINVPKMVGYDEDSNVIVLATYIGNFMLQLDLTRFKIISKRRNCRSTKIHYPYRNFYTAGRGVGWKKLALEL